MDKNATHISDFEREFSLAPIPYKTIIQNEQTHLDYLFKEFLQAQLKPSFALYVKEYYSDEEYQKGVEEVHAKMMPTTVTANRRDAVAANFYHPTDFEKHIADLNGEFYKELAQNKLAQKFYCPDITKTPSVITLLEIQQAVNTFQNSVLEVKTSNWHEYTEKRASELFAWLADLQDQNLSLKILEHIADDAYNTRLFIAEVTQKHGKPELKQAQMKWAEIKNYLNRLVRNRIAELGGISETPVKPTNRDFTTARQVLALHYMLEQLQVRSTETDKAARERLTHFLTGKNEQNIHAAFTNPHVNPKTKNFRFDDLKYIREFFEDLGLSEVVKAINNQLEKPR